MALPKIVRFFAVLINLSTKVGCCVAFIVIASYQVRKYLKNDDASIFSVREFKDLSWEVFPAITLCFATGKYAVSEELFTNETIRTALNLSVIEYGNVLLGMKVHDDMDRVMNFDFEKNTMNLRNYLNKFRIQDTNENEYEWKYEESLEFPNFEYVINRPYEWNQKQNITKNKIPLIPRYLDPYVKCFTHHPSLDQETTVDSIDFYFYISNGKFRICFVIELHPRS